MIEPHQVRPRAPGIATHCAPAPGIKADLHRAVHAASWLRLTTVDRAVPGAALVTIDDWLRSHGSGEGGLQPPGLRAQEIAPAYGAQRFEITLQEEAGERSLLVASLGAASQLRWLLRLDRRECRLPTVAWQQLSTWALERGERQLSRQLRGAYRLDPARAPEPRRK